MGFARKRPTQSIKVCRAGRRAAWASRTIASCGGFGVGGMVCLVWVNRVLHGAVAFGRMMDFTTLPSNPLRATVALVYWPVNTA